MPCPELSIRIGRNRILDCTAILPGRNEKTAKQKEDNLSALRSESVFVSIRSMKNYSFVELALIGMVATGSASPSATTARF